MFSTKLMIIPAAVVAAGLFASPAEAQFECDLNGVPGVPGSVLGSGSMLCGTTASAAGPSTDVTAIGVSLGFGGDELTLIGAHAFATIGGSFPSIGGVGNYSPPNLFGSTAIGAYSAAAGAGSVAIGDQALVGDFAFGLGTPNSLSVLQFVNNGTAVGSHTIVSGEGGTAVGFRSEVEAEGLHGTAVGMDSRVQATDGLAIGFRANVADDELGDLVFTAFEPAAGSLGGTSIGTFSMAYGNDNVAIGSYATVGEHNQFDAYTGSTAVGASANVTADQSVALGAHSSATATNSVALGAGSLADQANTVSVGTVGSERRIVNVAPGTAATDAVNVSQLSAVTGDVAAVQTTVATHSTQIAAVQAVNTTQATQIAAIQGVNTTQTTQITAIQAVNTTQATQITALQATDTGFDTRIDALEALSLSFDEGLDRVDDRASAGTAAAVALSGAMFLPGKTFNLTGNVGSYRGAHAAALQFGALVSDNVALNAGIAHGFNKGGKTALRAGFTIGW